MHVPYPSCKPCIYTCTHNDIIAVYRSLRYRDVVQEAAEVSMNLAVNEVKELPNYPQSGEVQGQINMCAYVMCIVADCSSGS